MSTPPVEVVAVTPPPKVEAPTPAQATPIKRQSKTPSISKTPKVAPKVFGLSDKALTAPDNDTSSGAVALPRGNTLETAPVKNPPPLGDAELPVPVAEYLVTSMPTLRKDVRISYPREARQRGLQGSVVMELLIDETGVVREVTLISGPGSPLNEAAIDAAKKLLFSPAKRDQTPVAVISRYTYIFDLRDGT